ncbi:NAD-dependent epimerase/dehydratase family protein [Nonomuraea sp. 3-1Str]|uniref:NAD-dependent epimerase/dehydratase family protein n=1 Tax=Nonomuraea sp. 3-1Str TaxID=2929801 RepID=UPI00285F390C|nr:NAD-dependent epimerase/dehydratase family protein [Nonomuraea sp. 3-1Str]MDR8414508.1 NAD-dependent epimerase/dehydratase family protein [Nonomuraea sp. 3-1Str]
MRVLVTGASGFVGAHAAVALAEAGHEPHLLVRDPAKAARSLAGAGLGRTGASWPQHRADIRDAAAVRDALERCDAVLHAAADMGVTGHGADLRGSNVVGLRNVLDQAVELRLDPVVHVSTVAVFVPPAGPVITAGSPLAGPRNAYGRSKVEGERHARSLDGVTIVYPGGLLGPGQPRLDALNEGIRAGTRSGWPIVPGGVCVLDVRDLAEALARCFTPGQGARRHLIGGHFLTWAELAALCAELTGRRGRAYRLPAGLLRGAAAALDGAKALGARIAYPLTRDAAEIMLTMVPTDDAPALEALGVTLRPVRDTVSDTLRWLCAEGHLDRREIGRLSP